MFYFLKASPIHPSPSFSLKLSVLKTTQNCLKYMFLTSGHTGMLVLRGCCCNCTGGGQCQGRALRPATASLRSLTSLTLNTVDVRLWHSQPSSSYTLNVTCNMWSHSITLTLSIYPSNPVKHCLKICSVDFLRGSKKVAISCLLILNSSLMINWYQVSEGMNFLVCRNMNANKWVWKSYNFLQNRN